NGADALAPNVVSAYAPPTNVTTLLSTDAAYSAPMNDTSRRRANVCVPSGCARGDRSLANRYQLMPATNAVAGTIQAATTHPTPRRTPNAHTVPTSASRTMPHDVFSKSTIVALRTPVSTASCNENRHHTRHPITNPTPS